MQKPFKNRAQAGMLLARQLMPYARRPDVKLGRSGQSEYAIGAISSDQSLLQTDVIKALGAPMEAIEAVVARERKEIERREALYRGGRPPLQLRDKVVILVDNGLATGSTMRVALQAVRKAQPAKVIVAVPVSAPETCQELAAEADEMICLSTPAGHHR